MEARNIGSFAAAIDAEVRFGGEAYLDGEEAPQPFANRIH